MATFVKYNIFVTDLCSAIHTLTAAGNVIKALIHTDAPVVATDTTKADLTQITGTGYTADGQDIQNDFSNTGGTVTATAIDVVWTATAADWTATARYVSTQNSSSSSKLINYWDYGATFALGNGETFTLDFGASWFTLV